MVEDALHDSVPVAVDVVGLFRALCWLRGSRLGGRCHGVATSLQSSRMAESGGPSQVINHTEPPNPLEGWETASAGLPEAPRGLDSQNDPEGRRAILLVLSPEATRLVLEVVRADFPDCEDAADVTPAMLVDFDDGDGRLAQRLRDRAQEYRDYRCSTLSNSALSKLVVTLKARGGF